MQKSGGPHAGFASGIISKNGGAARARPESRRMMSASDRRCLAAHGAGYLTCPSSGPSARVATAAAWTDRGCGFRGSGTDPARCVDAFRSAPGFTGAMKCIQQIMSATGPFRSAAPARLSAAVERVPGPVAGFARRLRKSFFRRTAARQRRPRWPPPPLISCRTLRQD